MWSLLAFIALSAAQSSAQTRIHNAILVIDTSNNASYNQVHWLVRTPYLSIKASNDTAGKLTYLMTHSHSMVWIAIAILQLDWLYVPSNLKVDVYALWNI